MYYVEVETYDGLKAGIHMMDNFEVWGVNTECFTVFKEKEEANKLLKSVVSSNQFKEEIIVVTGNV
ncbi:hypothetical protein RI065_06400 [Mycoplasmatota bacterium zrk1]